jgi:hypothetical protein
VFLPLVRALGVKKDIGAVFFITPIGFEYTRGILVIN